MVGYWVAAGARGRGIASSALRLVCDWSTARPLQLMTHPDNAASQRVAEKGGFRRLGMAPHLPAFRDGLAEAVLFQLDDPVGAAKPAQKERTSSGKVRTSIGLAR